MELGFDTDPTIIEYYRKIHYRKTQTYKQFLDNNNTVVDDDLKSKFWDIIVITAIDDLQKNYYENVLKKKVQDKEIPSFVKYYVIADPKGPKIGCGGSTLYVLSYLYHLDSQIFKSSKILLLHAGGYSKRLPNHSTTGKIFASVPYTLSTDGDYGVACTMLEMKLIQLIDFPKRMKPGVFLACSDDIELFESLDIDGFELDGFTAIAQPGTLDIGTGHGVFILEDNNNYKANCPTVCKQYIHKPSKEKMKQEGAILSDGNVLVDSCYFFDHEHVSKLLLQYYEQNKPITCEIDAYSDFLQPLGLNSKPSYFENTSNVTTYTPNLSIERKKLYDLLKENKVVLNTIPLFPSTFIHIGTCHEYIEHFTVNFPKLGFPKSIFSISDSKKANLGFQMIHCWINQCKITPNGNIVMEYCKLNNVELRISDRSILSDLEIINNDNQSKIELVLPENTFLQTLSVVGGKFVTIYFGIDDNLKSTSNPTFFGQPLLQVISNVNNTIITPISIWNENEQIKSLWNASIFPECDSPTESLLESLKLYSVGIEKQPNTNRKENIKKYYSMEECLIYKDLDKQYSRRTNLTNEIKSIFNSMDSNKLNN
eukprot:gene9737-11958_t